MVTINGTAGNDILTGSDDADIIYGLAGDDTIDGGLGADSLYGGSGNDLFKFTSVQSSFPAPTAIGLLDGGDGYDTIDWSQISPVTLGTIQSAAGAYVLGAYVGSQKFELKDVERINFGGGNDSVYPASTVNGIEIHLGAGNDTAQANANDRIFGEAGDDNIFISGSYGGSQKLGLADGGEGLDTLVTNISFSVDLAAGTATAGNAVFQIGNFEKLEMILSGYAATGLGDESSNVMRISNQGDDGKAGVTFNGRAGNDYISGGTGNDVLRGGLGVDTVSYEYATSAVRVDLAAGLASGGAGRDTLSGFESVVGSAYADTIVGDSGRNSLAGGAGNDLLVTVDGTKGIKPAGGFDVIDGGTGFDTIRLGGVRSDYQFLSSGDKGYLVTNGSAVQLTNVEGVQFYDTSFAGVSGTIAGVKALDGLSYLASYRDLFTAFGTDASSGTAHFAAYGFSEGRSVTFNGLNYIASYQDLQTAFGADASAGARHFIEWGAAEQRGTTFDGWTYLASYGELINAFGADENAATRHYIEWGAKEGRTASFDAAAYARDNPDLVAAIGNDPQALARHYVMYGYTEGRLSGASNDSTLPMEAHSHPSQVGQAMPAPSHSPDGILHAGSFDTSGYGIAEWTNASSHLDAFGFA